MRNMPEVIRQLLKEYDLEDRLQVRTFTTGPELSEALDNGTPVMFGYVNGCKNMN